MAAQDKSQIFKKVNLSEKKALFRVLQQDRSVLLIKGEEDHIFHMISTEVRDDKILAVTYPSNEPVRMQKSQNVIINFEVSEDRYFFNTNVILAENQMLVDLAPDLFVLQRRKTARIEIPEKYPHQVRILEYLGKGTFVEGVALDFSSGGCRVSVPKHDPIFRANQEIQVSLQFSFRKAVILRALIKHKFPSPPDQPDAPQVFGIQFVELNQIMENKMLMMFMDIQREIFLKYSV
jgi:alginate biosynthesis protein Alg44